ncbi:MAG: class I SAM-dependent methyltransferase [Candidatus Aureabacteria bacterium]|nr:class I SAM-dependent methyltransferase [Candidatus Auribacterota bacterium]
MKNDNSNTWLNAKGNGQVESYTKSADVMVVERKKIIKLLCDLFFYHFPSPVNLKVLDLGCGDGIITEHLHNKYPKNNFYLMDGSTAMLLKAKERLKDKAIKFIEMSFEEYIEKKAENDKYNFVFSSMATHHLPFESKGKLYSKINIELCRNGLFLNYDVVLPTSGISEKIQFQMWVDWMNEALQRNNLGDEVGKFNGLPNIYKSKEENKPSDLFDQLNLLTKAGFKNADCFFKYSIFALFGGTK